MPIAILDLVVIGVVVISGLLAAVRGATREVLAIVAWVAAFAVAWYLHPYALPYAAQYIDNAQIALAASIGGIFLLTLIIVSLITVKISDFILDSRIGAIDRTLGFVFGAFRGFLICAIGWIFLAWLVQGRMPDWTDQARTRAVLENTSESLIGMFPQNVEEMLGQFRSRPPGDPEEPAAPNLQQRS
jgi:membrane protein required for colicin V production